jgi:hypothetical protein
MARLAGNSIRMTCRYDLRKALRLCSAGFMALRAQHSGVQLGGLNGRIVSVGSHRAVTSFAIYGGMLASLFLVRYIRVAGFAGLAAREMNGLRGDFAECSSAVVPVLSKCVRHEPDPYRQKYEDCHCENPREAKEVSGIAKARHRPHLPPPSTNEGLTIRGSIGRMLGNAAQENL